MARHLHRNICLDCKWCVGGIKADGILYGDCRRQDGVDGCGGLVSSIYIKDCFELKKRNEQEKAMGRMERLREWFGEGGMIQKLLVAVGLSLGVFCAAYATASFISLSPCFWDWDVGMRMGVCFPTIFSLSAFSIRLEIFDKGFRRNR